MGLLGERRSSVSGYLLGPGLFGSWGFLVFFWMQSTGFGGAQAEALYLCSMLIVPCIVIVTTGESAGLATARAMGRAGCLAIVAGFAANAALSLAGAPSAELAAILQVLLGAGVSLFWIAWAFLLARFEVGRVELAFLWWTPLLAGVFALVSAASALLQDVASYAALLLAIPLLSLAAFEKACGDAAARGDGAACARGPAAGGDPSSREDEPAGRGLSADARVFLNLAVVHMSLSLVWASFFRVCPMGFETSSLMFAAGSLAVFLVIWLALRMTRRFGLSTMYLWMLPMMAAGVALGGLALSAAGGPSEAAFFVLAFLCLSTVNIGFEIMVKLLSIHMAMRSPDRAWRLVSLGAMIPSIGGLVSPAVLSALQSQGEAGYFYQIMLVAMAVFVAAISVALGRIDSGSRGIVLIGRESSGALGAEGPIAARDAAAAPASAGDPGEESPSARPIGPEQAEGPGSADEVDRRCVQAARRFGLSARELDVLSLLVRGRSRTYIREALFISKGTVDTHIHRIYAKMGIGSKNELMALVLDEEPR